MEELWKIYHTQLLKYISSKVNDKEEAKDILHEVFIKIHKNIQYLNDTQRLRSWIYTITKNTIVDYYRKQNKKIKGDIFIEDKSLSEDAEIKEELSFCLGYLIEKLPNKYKEAIQISEIEGKTQEELANYAKISLSGAKSRVQRGRKLLKQMLLECCEVELNDKERLVDFSIKDEETCELVKTKKIGDLKISTS